MNRDFASLWRGGIPSLSNPSTRQDPHFTEVFLKSTRQVTRQEPSGTRQALFEFNPDNPDRLNRDFTAFRRLGMSRTPSSEQNGAGAVALGGWN